MSDATLSSMQDDVLEGAVEATWAQWSALGAGALGTDRDLHSIVDPEALVLLSLYLIPVERRLRDFVRWWAAVGSDLLSVQRTKTLLNRFPEETRDRLGTFGRWAVAAGDKRWRRYATDDSSRLDRDRKGRDHPNLMQTPALLLRLRAGFGVSAKADVLAYLLGLEKRAATVRDATWATAYSRATVGGALDDLSRAGFVEETGGRPARYFPDAPSWEGLLLGGEGRDETLPSWRHWGEVYAFLVQVVQWTQANDTQTDYVRSSRARDVFDDFERLFEANRIRVPSPERYQGPAYLDGFAQTVERVVQWIPEHL